MTPSTSGSAAAREREGLPAEARRAGTARVGLGILLAVAYLLVFLALYGTGWIGVALITFLPVAAVTGVVWFLVVTARRRVAWGLWRSAGPAARRGVAFARSSVRSIAWVIIGSAAHTALPRSSMTESDAHWGVVSVWAAVVLLVLREFVPTRRAGRMVTVALVALAAFCLGELGRLAFPPTTGVELHRPVTGEWVVLSGGNSALVNHHFPLTQQRYALDLGIRYDHSATRRHPTDFPAFGQPVLAPVDGVVTRVVADRPDQPLGQRDADHPAGNYVVLRMSEGRYVLLAHLRAGSIGVEAGQPVRVGDRLAQVGNSGNSAEPHLHLQVQTGPQLVTADGRGWADVSTVPIGFAPATGTDGPTSPHRTDDRLDFSTAGAPR